MKERYNLMMMRAGAIFVFLLIGMGLFTFSWAETLQSDISLEEPAVEPKSSILDELKAEEYATDIPSVIISGLDAYKLQGAEAAIRRWIKGGPIEGDAKALASVDALKEIETVYGKYVGYQLIRTEYLTASSKLTYLQMNYEKGPLFVRFLCYWTGSRWVVTGRFLFDTEPQKAFLVG